MQNKTLGYAILKLKKIGLKKIVPRLAWNHTERLGIKTYKSTLIKVLFGWVENGEWKTIEGKLGFSFFWLGGNLGSSWKWVSLGIFHLGPPKLIPPN